MTLSIPMFDLYLRVGSDILHPMTETNMYDLVELTSYDEVKNAWDGEAVLVRSTPTEDGGQTVSVYPQLGRGFSYPEFDLRSEYVLATFGQVSHALLWARGKGYEATEIR